MNKSDKQSKVNQALSAFLVIAYVLCMYFLSNLIGGMDDGALKQLANIAIYVVFGLLLFYATRVGDGKQIKRFSLSVLILMVLPGLYFVLAPFAPGLPFSNEITSSTALSLLGYVMLGYGIPYTFTSGYEIDQPEMEEEEIGSTVTLNTEEEELEEEAMTEEGEVNTEPEEEAEPAEESEADEETTAEAEEEAKV